MAISDDQAAAFAAPGTDLAIFFRLATDPVVRLWSGPGDFQIPSDGIEPGGAIYKGVGTLQGLPQLQALVNGVAERVTFGLSGVDADVMEMADSESQIVRNKTVNVGIAPLDANLQIIGTVAWLRSYEADVLAVDRTSDKDGKAQRTVSLSVGSAFTGRRRPPIANFTDADQKRRSPDDRFCERTPLYSQGVLKTWPRF
jgi:hypothetical protein